MSDEELKTALNCCMEWTANGGKTDCENCPMDKTKPCLVNLHLAVLKRIDELETDNAALRERLDKAIELPVKLGDRVFCIVGRKPALVESEVIKIEVQKSNLSYTVFEFQGIDVRYKTTGWLSEYGKRWFTELKAAEKKLAELGGGE